MNFLKLHKKALGLYLIMIIISSIFYIPLEPYAVNQSTEHIGEITKLNVNKEYYHIYSLPKSGSSVIIKTEERNYKETAKLIYKLSFTEYFVRHIIISILFALYILIKINIKNTILIFKFLKKANIVILVGALALFSGCFNMSFAYYDFLRVFISIISVCEIATKYKTSKIMIVIFMISLSLFNPIWKIMLDKDTWRIIDILFGLIFMYLSYAPKEYRD